MHRALPPPEPPGENVYYPDISRFNDVFHLLILPSGDGVLNLSSLGRLQMSSEPTGTILWDVQAHEALGQYAMAIIGTNIVATAGGIDESRDVEFPSGRVRTWNIESGAALGDIRLDRFPVSSVAAVNAQRFVAGSHTGEIVICEHDRGARFVQLRRIAASMDEPLVRGESMIGRYAVCGEMLASLISPVITIWNASTLARLSSFRTVGENHGDIAKSIDMTDRQLVVGCLNAPHVRVYSVTDNYSCISSEGAVQYVHSKTVTSVHILDSEHILSASMDETVAISAVSSSAVVARIKINFVPVWTDVLSNGSIAVAGDRKVAILAAPHGAVPLLKAYVQSRNRAF